MQHNTTRYNSHNLYAPLTQLNATKCNFKLISLLSHDCQTSLFLFLVLVIVCCFWSGCRSLPTRKAVTLIVSVEGRFNGRTPRVVCRCLRDTNDAKLVSSILACIQCFKLPKSMRRPRRQKKAVSLTPIRGGAGRQEIQEMRKAPRKPKFYQLQRRWPTLLGNCRQTKFWGRWLLAVDLLRFSLGQEKRKIKIMKR